MLPFRGFLRIEDGGEEEEEAGRRGGRGGRGRCEMRVMLERILIFWSTLYFWHSGILITFG